MRSTDVAKSVNRRSLRRSRAADDHVWELRHVTAVDPGNVLEQPIFTFTDERIYPKVSEINEYEAANIGQNVRAGDLKMIVDTFVTITETTLLICDGEKVDVYRSPGNFYDSQAILRTFYVRRPKERTDV